MSAVIKTTQATIAKATISISTLRVDGRSLTLNLFKQLPERDIIKYDGTLCALEMWGTVRYGANSEWLESGCCNRWVIACHEGVLYRCAVWHQIWSSYASTEVYQNRLSDLLVIQKHVIEWAEALDAHKIAEEKYRIDRAAYTQHNIEWRKTAFVGVYDVDPNMPKPVCPERPKLGIRYEHYDEYDAPKTLRSINMQVATARAWAEASAACDKSMRVIDALPQLFIGQ